MIPGRANSWVHWVLVRSQLVLRYFPKPAFRYFDFIERAIGDSIVVNSLEGTVEDIQKPSYAHQTAVVSLFQTQLECFNGKYGLPTTTLWVRSGYDDDEQKAKQIILDILTEMYWVSLLSRLTWQL